MICKICQTIIPKDHDDFCPDCLTPTEKEEKQ